MLFTISSIHICSVIEHAGNNLFSPVRATGQSVVSDIMRALSVTSTPSSTTMVAAPFDSGYSRRPELAVRHPLPHREALSPLPHTYYLYKLPVAPPRCICLHHFAGADALPRMPSHGRLVYNVILSKFHTLISAPASRSISRTLRSSPAEASGCNTNRALTASTFTPPLRTSLTISVDLLRPVSFTALFCGAYESIRSQLISAP